MNKQPGQIRVAQCWDDGVTDDIRLIEILRRYNAKASFNLNIKLHDDTSAGWRFRDVKDVHRIAKSDLVGVYDGFLVANHTATHPSLTKLAPEDAVRDIRDGKEMLEQLFGYAVTGFAYPFGDYNSAVEDMVRDSGHVYARAVPPIDDVLLNTSPMAFRPNCHFMAADFQSRFEHAASSSGIFYFWGHSYEMVTDDDWNCFEAKIKLLAENPRVNWIDLPSLFE